MNISCAKFKPDYIEDIVCLESEDYMNDGLNNCCCNNNGLFRCGGSNSEILLFLVVFLLLFTNFGCCGCGN